MQATSSTSPATASNTRKAGAALCVIDARTGVTLTAASLIVGEYASGYAVCHRVSSAAASRCASVGSLPSATRPTIATIRAVRSLFTRGLDRNGHDDTGIHTSLRSG